MRNAAIVAILAATLPLSGCFVVFPVPSRDGGPPTGPSVQVDIDGRTLDVRRGAETFPENAPVNALTDAGIAVLPEAPLPVRGVGEPAVIVGGTALGEWEIAERAVIAACAAESLAPTGVDAARATYDADRAEALFPATTCPALDP